MGVSEEFETHCPLAHVRIRLLIEDNRYNPLTRATIPAAVLSFIVALAVCVLSAYEHTRGIRPSTILTLYLLTSVAFDSVQVRTLYLHKDANAILSLFTTAIGIKFALLLLEGRSKQSYLKAPYNKFSPETTSGVLNRSFSWWLNPLLTAGWKKILTLNDLFETDQGLLSEPLLQHITHAWNKRISTGRLLWRMLITS